MKRHWPNLPCAPCVLPLARELRAGTAAWIAVGRMSPATGGRYGPYVIDPRWRVLRTGMPAGGHTLGITTHLTSLLQGGWNRASLVLPYKRIADYPFTPPAVRPSMK